MKKRSTQTKNGLQSIFLAHTHLHLHRCNDIGCGLVAHVCHLGRPTAKLKKTVSDDTANTVPLLRS